MIASKNKSNKKWNPTQFNGFMTDKEKNYVASVFRKKINTTGKIYNYKMFFEKKLETENEKIKVKEFSVDMDNESLITELKGLSLEKKEGETPSQENSTDKKPNINKISFIKSQKLPRLMLDSDVTVVDDIAIKLNIETIIDEYICWKYQIRDSKLKEIFIENQSRIHEFFKVPKFRKLMCDVFKECDEDLKCTFFMSMLQKSQLLVDYGNISEFFDYLVSFIPQMKLEDVESSNFFDNFMFNLPGVLLATLLLINQEEFAEHFFKSIKPRMEYLFDVQLKYVWRFLAILLINLSNEDKKWMISVLKEKIIQVVVTKDKEKIAEMSPLFEALGLEFKDIV